MIGELLRKYRSDDGPGDIVSFSESRYGLKQTLFPAQKFAMKLFYGIPLDGKNKTIRTRDPFTDKTEGFYTEREYLTFLHNEGRCNWSEERVGHECHELVLVMGRRSGKSKVISVVSCYEYARLLSHDNPHDYFRLPQSDMIKIINVAASKDQAVVLFDSVSNLVLESDYLKHYLSKDPLKQEIRFRSQWEIDNRAKNFQGTIRSVIGGATSRTIRGSGAVVVILDELAHFLSNDGKASDTAVYEALTPSLANFKHPDNTPAGKTISLSSPMGRQGKFFELYDTSMKPENSDLDILCLQVPTWDMNPDIPSDFFADRQRKSPTAFRTEFGAEFSDQVNVWIEDPEQFKKNFHPPEIWERQPRGDHRKQYFMGLDLGSSNDGTGIAVCHWEPMDYEGHGEVVLDYHAVYYANRTNDQHPKYRDTPPQYEMSLLPVAEPVQRIDDVATEVLVLTREFPIKAGIFDQYQGIGLYQRLVSLGLNQFEMKQFSPTETSEMYASFKQLYQNVQLRLYEDPLLKWEFQTLQSSLQTGHRLKVDHPSGKGYHNDLADAVVRASWLVMQHLTDKKLSPGGAFVLGPGQHTGQRRGPGAEGPSYHQQYRQYMKKQRNSERIGQVMKMRRQGPW
jgi:phage terminase large subunit-like protein